MDSENLTAKRRLRLPALTAAVGRTLLFLWCVRAAGQSHLSVLKLRLADRGTFRGAPRITKELILRVPRQPEEIFNDHTVPPPNR